jgi:hypothetical protein
MDEFSDIWIEQCDAAREIRDAWGIRKALGYLVAEKLLNDIRASDSDPSWAEAAALRGGGQANLHSRRTARILRDDHACRPGSPRRDR